jgi:hypothetical protein
MSNVLSINIHEEKLDQVIGLNSIVITHTYYCSCNVTSVHGEHGVSTPKAYSAVISKPSITIRDVAERLIADGFRTYCDHIFLTGVKEICPRVFALIIGTA